MAPETVRQSARLRAPEDFDLRSTVRSHGWSDLAPFDTDRTGDTLEIRLGFATATVTEAERGSLRVQLASRARLTKDQRESALQSVRSCLRFDLDLGEFWALCRSDSDLAWADEKKAGRFLRAPTAFADAAMILATTNCSWALTKRIVRSLTDRWGTNGAFPEQRRLARIGEQDLRRHASLGYRAPYLAKLARGPDLEPLRDDPTPTPDLKKRLLGLPGFGPYAAENMLRSLGRFEHLAIDSMVVRRWKTLFPRRRATESAIARHFGRYGPWRGLALWLVLTRHWYEIEVWKIE